MTPAASARPHRHETRPARSASADSLVHHSKAPIRSQSARGVRGQVIGFMPKHPRQSRSGSRDFGAVIHSGLAWKFSGIHVAFGDYAFTCDHRLQALPRCLGQLAHLGTDHHRIGAA